MKHECLAFLTHSLENLLFCSLTLALWVSCRNNKHVIFKIGFSFNLAMFCNLLSMNQCTEHILTWMTACRCHFSPSSRTDLTHWLICSWSRGRCIDNGIAVNRLITSQQKKHWVRIFSTEIVTMAEELFTWLPCLMIFIFMLGNHIVLLHKKKYSWWWQRNGLW